MQYDLQSCANEAKRRRVMDWIAFGPLDTFSSVVFETLEKLKVLFNLFYSCEIALKTFFHVALRLKARVFG